MTKRSIHLQAFSYDPASQFDGVPDWVHLLPLGEAQLVDGRQAFTYDGSLIPMVSSHGHDKVDRVLIDVNHANAKLTHTGAETPAHGWIVELQARDNGLWGRVEWNDSGRALLMAKAYRGISAEVFTDAQGKVAALSGASLTNRPALRRLTPLFMTADPEPKGDTMSEFLLKLCAALKLKSDTSEAAVLAAASALVAADSEKALQLSALGQTVGAGENASYEQVLLSAKKLKAGQDDGEGKIIAELKAELLTVSKSHQALLTDISRERAETFIDAEMKKGRVGLTKTMRDHYIKRHMLSADDAKAVELEITALPILAAGSFIPAAPPADGSVQLSASDAEVAKVLGVSIDDFKKIRAAEVAA